MKPRRVRRGVSLRLRLLLGTALIAVLAAVAALITAFGAGASARQIEAVVRAETRIDLFGALSGRVGDYAVVAVEQAAAPAVNPGERVARLANRADAVRAAFQRLDSAIARSVEDARAIGADEQASRASRSIGLARMRAHFEALHRALTGPADAGDATLRAELDAFATRFSPLLNQAIEEERRVRDAAIAAAERLRARLIRAAVAVLGFAALAVVLFHLSITRPLLARLGEAAAATARIGRGGFGTRLAQRRRDELGLLFAQLNRAAARLGRDRASIDADRARLEEIVAERTAALRRANERLERIDAERRRFFADVGHELRTPLTVIMGEADLNLRAGTIDTADARTSFEKIRARARRLNRRIDDILRVARSETGQIELADESFALSDAIAAAVDDVAGPARRRRVSVMADEAPGLTVRGDRDWIRQIVAGLVENAIRHSPEDGRVRLRLEAQAGRAVLTVIDEGPGIPADEIGRIFERFARGGGAADRGAGFGVGLALARWIVERQSGAISATSPAPAPVGPGPRGPGAELRLELPLTVAPSPGPGDGGGDGR